MHRLVQKAVREALLEAPGAAALGVEPARVVGVLEAELSEQFVLPVAAYGRAAGARALALAPLFRAFHGDAHAPPGGRRSSWTR